MADHMVEQMAEVIYNHNPARKPHDGDPMTFAHATARGDQRATLARRQAEAAIAWLADPTRTIPHVDTVARGH